MSALQAALFRDDTKQKTLIHVPVEQCVISEFNPRQTRCEADIQRLAQRIERNGFELTRALWAYDGDGTYHVFAGGNRLEAVKRTTVDTVPVVLHEGFSDDEIVGLADQDNENDEYHASVPIVDVWLEYKRLYELWGNQQRVADAKGVNQATVALRLQFASFPQAILNSFITNDFLKEGHAREIRQLLHCNNLSPWLTRDDAMLEVLQSVIAKYGKSVTAKHIADLVTQYNDLVQSARAHLGQLPGEYHAPYIAKLAKVKARSMAALHRAFTETMQAVAADKARQEEEQRTRLQAAEHQRQQAEAAQRLAEARQRHLARLVLGDARKVTPPKPIKLLFTDPPYGMDFQSNRRVVSAKAERIAGDQDADSALALLDETLQAMLPCMADDSFVLVWCDWRQQCAVSDLLEQHGLTIREEVIWNKPNHSSGDLFGAPARKHEKFLFAVKGNPKLVGARFETVLEGKRFVGSDHPTEKPVDLIATVIESCTEPGELVADPFMGSGGVVLTAFGLGRDFWGCEVDPAWHAVASDHLLQTLEGTNE